MESANMDKFFLGRIEFSLWVEITKQFPSLGDIIVKIFEKRENKQLLNTVNELACREKRHEEIFNKLKQLRLSMRNSLKKSSERLALIYMLESIYRLDNPPINLNKNEQSSQDRILSELKNIPRKATLMSTDFDKLMSLIREHYQTAINSSINALCNIYRYEILYLHNELQQTVKEIFDKLKSNRNNREIQHAVLESEAKEEFSQVRLLEKKLQTLKGKGLS